MQLREILAVNLVAIRHSAGLSQEDLAHRADVDRTYVSAIERCRYAASVDILERLAAALNVDASELLRSKR